MPSQANSVVITSKGTAATATQDEIWLALQERVCVKCIDGNGLGDCRMGQNGFCALKAYLPTIVEAVNAVQSPSILPHEEQLRRKVCSMCRYQSPSGHCSLRDHVECALDRYSPLIVEVIEETQHRASLLSKS